MTLGLYENVIDGVSQEYTFWVQAHVYIVSRNIDVAACLNRLVHETQWNQIFQKFLWWAYCIMCCIQYEPSLNFTETKTQYPTQEWRVQPLSELVSTGWSSNYFCVLKKEYIKVLTSGSAVTRPHASVKHCTDRQQHHWTHVSFHCCDLL